MRSRLRRTLDRARRGEPPGGTGPLAGLVVVDSAAANAQIRSGRLRALAVTSAQRTSLVPDAPRPWPNPAFPGMTSRSGRASSPRQARPPIVSRLYQEASRAMNAPDSREKLKGIAMDPGGMAPEQLSAMIKADIGKYGAIVKAAGIKGE